MFLIYFLSPHERWRRFCERNREFQRARRRWLRQTPGTPEERAAGRELSRIRKKLHRLGASLGMAEVATELLLPREFRSRGTPPIPRWILAR